MKIINIFFLFISLIMSSCATQVRKEYLLSDNSKIQKLEKQDHKFCESLKLELNKNDNYKSKLYWRCRLSMAKSKIKNNSFSAQDIKQNSEINELINRISLQISQTTESSFLKESRKLDHIHHLKCVRMGFNFDEDDQVKSDDYFACRRALIYEYQQLPAFNNPEYLKYPNSSYDLGFVVDMRIDNVIRDYKEAEAKHPKCIQYYQDKKSFNDCIATVQKSEDCYGGVQKKKFGKELEKKITCQKRSYLQFPDSLLNQKEIKTNKKPKVLAYDKNSLPALGLDEDDFIGERKQETKKSKTTQTVSKDDSNNGLYSRLELTQLRQDYILKCQREADTELEEYNNILINSCREIVYEK